MELHFNEQEVAIIKDICEIQISSFYNILRGNLLIDDKILLEQYQASLEVAHREAKWKISQYIELQKQPLYLGIMEDSDISTMRHILFHMEDEYLLNYPSGVKNLWSKFFLIEEARNPGLRITTKNLKKSYEIIRPKSVKVN